MILRAITAEVPPPLDTPGGARPIAAWQICGAIDQGGPWRPVNAGQIDREQPPAEITVAGRFGDNEKWVRVTFAGDRGSHDPLVQRVAPVDTSGQATRVPLAGASLRPGPGRIIR